MKTQEEEIKKAFEDFMETDGPPDMLSQELLYEFARTLLERGFKAGYQANPDSKRLDGVRKAVDQYIKKHDSK